MAEYKCFDGDEAQVSTFDFHKDRERAPHLEQLAHRPRLKKAAEFVMEAYRECQKWKHDPGISDLGCGDGGLLSILPDGLHAWGYDFTPANATGWYERNIEAYSLSFVNPDGRLAPEVDLGDIVVMTEVLEHLTYPRRILTDLASGRPTYLVASSPWTETDESHDGCHAWAWDLTGYSSMLSDCGWEPIRHTTEGMFQVTLRKKKA